VIASRLESITLHVDHYVKSPIAKTMPFGRKLALKSSRMWIGLIKTLTWRQVIAGRPHRDVTVLFWNYVMTQIHKNLTSLVLEFKAEPVVESTLRVMAFLSIKVLKLPVGARRSLLRHQSVKARLNPSRAEKKGLEAPLTHATASTTFFSMGHTEKQRFPFVANSTSL